MRNLIPSWVRVLVIFFLLFIGIEYFAASGDRPAFLEEPLILLFLLLVLFILIAIEGIVAAMENILFNGLDEAGKERYLENKNKVPEYKLVNWFKKTYKKLLGAKPIEAEAETEDGSVFSRGIFYSESAILFSDLQISPKNIPNY